MLRPDDIEELSQQVEAVRSLMEGIVKALVDSETDAVVKASSAGTGTVLVIEAALEDIGKIVGKQGRTARSLRTILNAASMRSGHSFSLDVQESA